MLDTNIRPSHVRFENRAVEDREQSIKLGHFVTQDKVFVIITPPGSKDTVEKDADDWIAHLRQAVRDERFPADWLQEYEKGYAKWKENETEPEFGTPIKTWPAISIAQQKNILSANIRTIEELSEANENAMNRIGMGSRELKAKAKAWLDVANSKGKIASELDALRVEKEILQSQVNQQALDLKELKAQIAALQRVSA